MTDEGQPSTVEGICPHLGLAEDPSVRYLGVTSSHRCFRGQSPRAVSATHQDARCLSGKYQICPLWIPDAESDELEEPADLFGSEAEGPRARWTQRLLTAFGSVAWAALVLAGFVLVAPLFAVVRPGAAPEAANSRGGSDGSSLLVRPERLATPAISALGSTSGSATVSPSGETVIAPQKSSTAAPATKSTPGTVPTRAPTAVPPARKAPATPVPAGKLHVVQQKDTLWSLAKAYGVTVEEIVRANGLKSQSVIRLGQKLVIPEPRRGS